ncbi:DUF6950 family protein [Roseovarius sp.]|uniref:DUF6950 family protein n=1 Tax=Roseovarius sp. TaxID=1486281 RepID=UPI003A9716B1
MTERDILLRQFLDARRGTAFRPGLLDCALFAADWIVELTGVDPAADWRGRYRTIEEGRALLAADGFASPAEVLASMLVEGAGWMQAQTGDVAVLIEAGEEAMGVVGGGHIHALRPLRGLGVVPINRAVRIYRP